MNSKREIKALAYSLGLLYVEIECGGKWYPAIRSKEQVLEMIEAGKKVKLINNQQRRKCGRKNMS